MAAQPLNIALTGFMGTGKSAVARLLGKLTGYKVVDVDHEIEREAGMEISEIFEKLGEPAFRDMESAAMRRIAQGRGQIISTGGGAVLRAENMEAVRSGGGVVVNLAASPETVYERTRHASHRPLLDVKDPLARIREMMSQREKYYANADVVVETDGVSLMELAKEIVELIGLVGWRK